MVQKKVKPRLVLGGFFGPFTIGVHIWHCRRVIK